MRGFVPAPFKGQNVDYYLSADGTFKQPLPAGGAADKVLSGDRKWVDGGINLLKRNHTYVVGDIAYSAKLPSWAYLECVKSGTTGNTEPNFSNITTNSVGGVTDSSCNWIVKDIRSRHAVGDIIIRISKPGPYDYVIACSGQNFDKNHYPQLAQIFTNGKLSNLNDNRFLEGSTSWNQYKEAGIPNIWGNFPGVGWGNNYHTEGAFYSKGESSVKVKNSGEPDYQYAFDASRCSSIYGKSSTVQPKSYTVTYYICYA